MRYALRQLARTPWFTCAALVTLGLSIGVNTTAFTVLNRIVLQSVPFHEPSRLVQIWAATPKGDPYPQAPGDYFDERDQSTSFEQLAAYVPYIRASLAEPNRPPVQVSSVGVTANFFPLFGIQPQFGRTFSAEDEAQQRSVAVISNAYWREHYDTDPNVLGKTAKLNRRLYTIVGVLPPAYDEPLLFAGFGQKPAFIILDNAAVNRTLRHMNWYTVGARLKPGVTLEQAQAELTAIAQRLARAYPTTNGGRGFKVVPYPKNAMEGIGANVAWLILALSAMVLLIACANLANLQLVRTMSRTQEIGVRIALGCPQSAIVRMLLTESVLVSVAGGALGLLAAKWSNTYVASFYGVNMPIDFRVIGFAFVIALVSGGIFGTVPAWIASRTDVNTTLKSGGRAATADRSRHWLRQSLVAIELSLALLLLAAAGFFVSGIYRLTHQDLGWDAPDVVVGFIELDHDHYGEQGDARSLVFGEAMVRRLQTLPGVDAVALSMSSPAWGLGQVPFRAEGQPAPERGKEIFAGRAETTPDFLRTYGIQLVQGRNFSDSDRPDSPKVVIVNEALANKFWPGENPIGKRIGEPDPAKPDWAEVVGVMRDFKGAADIYNPAATSYKILRPWAQNTHRFIGFHVRLSSNAAASKETIRKAVAELAPDVAVTQLATVPEVLASEVSYFTFIRRILLQTSILGLLLAAVGIYGVVASLASERKVEIGIRMALGAQATDVVWLFLRNGLKLALIGAVIGTVLSFLVLSILEKILPMVPGRSPWAVVIVAIFLVAVAALASWLPAQRTARVDPTLALRG